MRCQTRFMRPRRIAIVLFLLLLLPPVAALLLLWADEDRAVAMLPRIVELATPYELSLRNPELSWAPFRFSADLLLLEQKDVEGPPVVAVQKLDLAMPLGEFLGGQIDSGGFTASNVTYYIDDSQSEEDLDLEALLSPLSRLPARVAVDSVHLISRSAALWIFPVLDLRAQRGADSSLLATATAAIGNRPVALKTRARWLSVDDGSHRLELNTTAFDRDGASELQLAGALNARGAELDYAFTLTGEYENVSDFVRALDAEAFPFTGNLRIDGQLSGDLDGYRLDISELSLRSEAAFEFRAEGRVSRDGAEPVALALVASGEASRLEGLFPLPAAIPRLLDRSELQFSIGGSLDAPSLSGARMLLFGPGDTRLVISSEKLAFTLDELLAQSFATAQRVNLTGRSGDLPRLLRDSADLDLPLTGAVSAQIGGTMEVNGSRFGIQLHSIALEHPEYAIDGAAELLWQEDLLSAPQLELHLREKSGDGQLSADGAIADLAQLRGVILALTASELDVELLAAAAGVAETLPVQVVDGTALALRAADTLRIEDLSFSVNPHERVRIQANGNLVLARAGTEADLQLSATLGDSGAGSAAPGAASPEREASGQLRLRPSYATLLTDVRLGQTRLQSVVTADLEEQQQTLGSLAIDVYSPHVHLEDLAPDPVAISFMGGTGTGAAGAAQGSLEDGVGGRVNEGAVQDTQAAATDPAGAQWRALLPDYPIHLTLRGDRITGALSALEDFSVAVSGEEGRFLLSHLDTRYAGGELILRGVLDVSRIPAQLSLAGQGIRVPLADFTRDIGLQEEISGFLSLRAGVSTRGESVQAWQGNLQGRVTAAVAESQISGAAYDLLMSNLLAWLVTGAGESTTTFDCAMAQFDISEGVARSSDLYLETPRMLASGKARLDLPGERIDVRLEPRSKARLFQFPSAVRIVGPLGDPEVRVSPLQTTADLGAQALLLLPSLTLKLFGIDPANSPSPPCAPADS